MWTFSASTGGLWPTPLFMLPWCCRWGEEKGHQGVDVCLWTQSQQARYCVLSLNPPPGTVCCPWTQPQVLCVVHESTPGTVCCPWPQPQVLYDPFIIIVLSSSTLPLHSLIIPSTLTLYGLIIPSYLTLYGLNTLIIPSCLTLWSYHPQLSDTLWSYHSQLSDTLWSYHPRHSDSLWSNHPQYSECLTSVSLLILWCVGWPEMTGSVLHSYFELLLP